MSDKNNAIDLDHLESQVQRAYMADARCVAFLAPATILDLIRLARQAAPEAPTDWLNDELRIVNEGIAATTASASIDERYQEVLRPLLSDKAMRLFLNGDPFELNPITIRAIIDRASQEAQAAHAGAKKDLLIEIQHAIDLLADTKMTISTYVAATNALHHCRDAVTGKGYYDAAVATSEQKGPQV